MKEYIKPEVEVVSLMAQESIASDLPELGGELDLSTNPFND